MTSTRKAAAIFVLSLLAILGNHFHLPLFFGVDLIFGSIPALLALSLFGLVPGVIVAAVGGAYTFFLWGHPYALVIIVAELLVVGLLRRRLVHLAMADALYWLFIGTPLVLFFYHWILDVNWLQTGLIALKQSINGIMNAMVAALIMLGMLSRKYQVDDGTEKGVSIASLLFDTMLTLALLAGLVPLVMNSYNMHKEVEREVGARLNFFGGEAARLAAESSTSLDRILDKVPLGEKMSLALVTPQGKIIAERGIVHSLHAGGTLHKTGDDMRIWRPDGKMAAIQRWRKGYYVQDVPVVGGGQIGRVVIEQAAEPSVDRIELQRFYALGLLVLIVLASIVLAALLSRWLSRPLRQLEVLSRNLPERIASGTQVAAFGSLVTEYNSLTNSIHAMAQALSENFREQHRIRDSLEHQVQERTAALLQREARLKESEAKFRTLYDTTSDAVMLLDEKGFSGCNNATLEMFGCATQEEFCSKHPAALSPPVQPCGTDSMTLANQRIATAMEHGSHRFEWLHQRADNGVIFPADVLLSVMELDGMKILQATVRDISERKQEEEALRAAKDAAESASRAKSEFLASMSHELRTPLNAILGFSQLFGMDPDLPEDTKEQAREIERAGHHLLSLVNDLIDLARIESGKLEFSLEPVLVKTVLADSLTLVAPIARKQGIELIDADGKGEKMVVRADYVRLRQVLINLLSNAIKYNRPQGSVRLSYRMKEGQVRISITDTGPGIPADKQARIFNAFDRLGAERGAIEGTGIGLVITQRIVEAMGGAIGFESIEGQGSTFWVELPLGETAEPHAWEEGVPVAAPEAASPQRYRPVVLYIEDNPMNLRLMQQIFAVRKDLELRDAHSAELGLELARAEPPALILLDINLPGMDGYEALAQLKGDPSTSHIPVVAVSANAMKGDEVRGFEAGFAAYLTKPFDIPALFGMLDSAITKETA